MSTNVSYPGTQQHQALLHQIVTYYRDDPRILALTLFGSVARGNWDQYSDLDLDVVIADHIQMDVLHEVHTLCATFIGVGERAILIAQDKVDAADVVLTSLKELSLRYHSLACTSPNIVESIQLLTGRIPVEHIRTAGMANVHPHSAFEPEPMDRFVRLALSVNREIHRHHIWQAVPLLERMRTVVVEVFTAHHGGGRPYPVFQAHAPHDLTKKLGSTLPQATLFSLHRAFLNLIEIVEHEQAPLGMVHGLTAAQQTILEQIKQQQHSLVFHGVDG